MQPTSADLLCRLAHAREIGFRRDLLPRSGWLRTSDGVRLHYLDWPGDGDVLLLLHGGSLSAHTFDLLALALRGAIRCIALDMRGHGLSDWADRYPIDRFAADVAELVDDLGLAAVHVAGMSLGGCVAGHAASLLGDRLKSLTFIDVADEVSFEATARMRGFIEQVRPVPEVEDLVAQALAVSPQTDPDLMSYRYRHLLKLGPDGFTWRMDRRRRPDFAAILGKLAELADLAPRLSCPVLVVKGGRSQVLSQSRLERFAGRFPDGPGSSFRTPATTCRKTSRFALRRPFAKRSRAQVPAMSGTDQAPSSAASRSASAISSTVLALKNGSSGLVGQVTVARR